MGVRERDLVGDGDEMDELWGEIMPVPEESLVVPRDGERVKIGGLSFTAIDTPGHVEHHYCYVLEDLCFTGDVGGIRIPGFPYVRLPMPPPELHFEKWQGSIRRLRALNFNRIAPTHFGVYEDAGWHLEQLEQVVSATMRWLEENMRANPDVEELRHRFLDWMHEDDLRLGMSAEAIRLHALANPLGMSADGLFRYWHKVRNAPIA